MFTKLSSSFRIVKTRTTNETIKGCNKFRIDRGILKVDINKLRINAGLERETWLNDIFISRTGGFELGEYLIYCSNKKKWWSEHGNYISASCGLLWFQRKQEL